MKKPHTKSGREISILTIMESLINSEDHSNIGWLLSTIGDDAVKTDHRRAARKALGVYAENPTIVRLVHITPDDIERRAREIRTLLPGDEKISALSNDLLIAIDSLREYRDKAKRELEPWAEKAGVAPMQTELSIGFATHSIFEKSFQAGMLWAILLRRAAQIDPPAPTEHPMCGILREIYAEDPKAKQESVIAGTMDRYRKVPGKKKKPLSRKYLEKNFMQIIKRPISAA